MTKKTGEWDSTIKTIILAGILAILFRSFLFQPFHIPSSSMKNTLLIGDYLFVSKYSYGYSRYSFPFGLPLFEGRVFKDENDIKRGDIAVFRPPQIPHIDFIKRIIGLPGDKIQMIDGALYLNGKAVEREELEPIQMRHDDGYLVLAKRYRETLPNGVSYVTLDLGHKPDVDNTGIYEVPKGHYFMMGDNRDNSADSRDQIDIGFVPEENFIGRAEIILLSINEGTRFWQFWKFFSGGLRKDRFAEQLNTD